jgi:GTP cyclohydrolase II
MKVEAGPSARLPLPEGEFEIQTWREPATGDEHFSLRMGEVRGASGVLVRAHSECLTGDMLGSMRCDCGAQLSLALARIAEARQGVLIYMRGHEGRGIGLSEKLRAYALQDQGMDTVDANIALGHPVDARRFDAAAAILEAMGVQSIRLMTNNPHKVESLQRLGVQVDERLAHEIQSHGGNSDYLATKRDRLGHLLDPHMKVR